MMVSWDIRLILRSTLAHRGDDRDTKSSTLALPGLTGSILGVDISTERERDAHTERLVDVLFR